MTELKKGDRVSWSSHGGTAHGTVERELTHDAKVNGHQVRASKDEPQYVVKSANGGEAVHKGAALKKA